MLSECQQTATSLQEFSAVTQLSSRLGDSLVMAEEMLDGALAKQCTNFQPEIYSKLQVNTMNTLSNTNPFVDRTRTGSSASARPPLTSC